MSSASLPNNPGPPKISKESLLEGTAAAPFIETSLDTGNQSEAGTSQTDKAFMKKASKALRSATSGKTKGGQDQVGSPKVVNLLRKALKLHNNAQYPEALRLTLEATALHPESALGHHMMAMALDHMGETHKALLMYEKTLELDPSEFDVYLNLGLTARKLNMDEAAEKFFRIYIDLKPEQHQGYNNLGTLFRDMNRFDEAIEVVKHALNLMPETAELWNTMGTIATESGKLDEAVIFYNEALRVNPDFHRSRYNLANFYMDHGFIAEALEDFEKFLKTQNADHNDAMEARYARSIALLALGRVEEGWKENRIRNNPRFRTSTLYATDAPMWNGEDVRGKNILVIGEQGVGDEIMFANPIRDLIERVGPDGNVLINVTKRLVPLFERAYPECLVGIPMFTSHNGKNVIVTTWENDRGTLDYHTPMGDLSAFLRPDAASYRGVGAFLQPDLAEIESWKTRLADLSDGLKVGLCWRSGLVTAGRGKGFAPLELWGPVFENTNATFINLQYGEVKEEVAEIQTRFGRTLHQMEGLDIRNDLDSNAALCCALDVVISAPTAAAALAGSVGTKTWFVITKRGWPSLGEEDYPFYADTQVFQQETFGDWDPTFRNLSAALKILTSNR
jgi:tetratricopeptide (TPR) repeat protein